ncbi:MAG: glycoside hydrolase family 3 N-terminal domain-containing protein [Christensenellales bacterium]|jgi:beta-glucosidase
MNSTVYADHSRSPEERAEALLSDLSLDEKMAQVNCIFPYSGLEWDFDWISRQVSFGIGEVSTLEVRSMRNLREAAAWQRRVQKMIMDLSPHHIPAIFHMEGLCGTMVQDGISLPSGIARGAGFDPELEENLARVVVRQEGAFGVGHILAPVLDIARDSRMGRYGEAYGEDPTLVAAMGAAYVRGIQGIDSKGYHPECVAKHFLAFHNSQGGIHGTHSDIPPRLLREIYGKPFQAAIQADVLCLPTRPTNA